MSRIEIATLEMVDVESFLKHFQLFMNEEIIETFIGVTKIKFEVNISETGSYKLVCETNRKLNMASRSYVRNLSHGFIGGWIANEKHG